MPGIRVTPDVAKRFQGYYWELENHLRIYIANEIVHDRKILPPTVDDTLVLVHAAHHCFRVNGASPECLQYAEVACDLATQSIQELKSRPDPFAKKTCLVCGFPAKLHRGTQRQTTH